MALADPVHFFDEEGVSALRRRQLESENAALRDRVDKLERLVAAQQRRLKALSADPMEKSDS